MTLHDSIEILTREHKTMAHTIDGLEVHTRPALLHPRKSEISGRIEAALNRARIRSSQGLTLNRSLLDGRAAMQSTETWKPIAGYEGLYEVSDHGNVRSLDRVDRNGARRRGRSLMGASQRYGHRYVTFSVDGATQKRWVHRLVLEAFVGPCPAGKEGCHEDGDATNNHVSNLRWDTKSANARDAVRHGTHSMKSKERCKRGHLLQMPNLTERSVRLGQRMCLACRREHDSYRSQGRTGFSETEADVAYVHIMARGIA